MHPTPEQLDALAVLAATSDDDLLADARADGLDVAVLVAQQRACIEATLRRPMLERALAAAGVPACPEAAPMIGTRVYPNADGWLDDAAISKPGAYGRVDVEKVLAGCAAAGRPVSADHPWMHWQTTTPDGHGGRLDPELHTVEEHEDGTITVTPSIDMSKRHAGGYHGFLRRGVWT